MSNLLSCPAFSETWDVKSSQLGYYSSDHHQPDKLTPFIRLRSNHSFINDSNNV